MIVASRLSAVWQGAGVAVAALVCYLVSQSVAAERANVVRLDAQIARARADIAKLTIEIGSRARMGQIERWNREVLALAAPTPTQFVADGVQLASLEGRSGRTTLPLNPAVAGQVAVDHVAYTPSEPALVRTEGVAVVQPAVATVARSQPLLHQAAYVQPTADRLGDPLPVRRAEPKLVEHKKLDAKPEKRPVGLLPDDIGALAAAEAKANKGAKAAR